MRNALILACVLAVVGYFGSKFYLHDKVTRNLDKLIAAAQPMVDISYEGVSSTFSGELGIDGVTVRVPAFADPVHIDSVRVITPGYFQLLGLTRFGSGDFEPPESFALAFRGLTMPVTADYLAAVAEARRAQLAAQGVADSSPECVGKYGFSPAMLQQLGYSSIVVDASAGYRLEAPHFIVDFTTNVADMYDVSVTLTFEGVPTPQSLAMRAYQPRLVNGRLEYVDRSLEERVMQLCTQQDLTEDAVIAARRDAFQTVASSNGIVFDEYVMDPYVEFLRGKDRFVLTAQPTEPVNLQQIGLYKPSDVPALLNLSAEAL